MDKIYTSCLQENQESLKSMSEKWEKILVLLEPSRPGPGHVGPETAVLAG